MTVARSVFGQTEFMSSLLLVTGPPGAGKSTVAAELSRLETPSVLIHGDQFFGFLAEGAIDPWLPESEMQNEIVTEAAAVAPGRFAADRATVYDGVVGPWFLSKFAVATGLAQLDYVILLPPVDVCVARVEARVGHGFTDEAATRKMHAEFNESGIDRRHLHADASAGVDEVVASISEARHAGQFRYRITS